MILAKIVYVLCSMGSLTVAALLWRTYRSSQVRFLLWSSLCFVGLAMGNLLLYVDMVIFRDGPDLSTIRILPTLAGYLILVFGFIWDTQ